MGQVYKARDSKLWISITAELRSAEGPVCPWPQRRFHRWEIGVQL